MAAPRSTTERRAAAEEKLRATHADAWVATGSDQAAHLVPLSYAWDGTQVILATEEGSVTVRNLRAGAHARLALGGTRDVVMIDATLETIASGDAAAEVAERYAGQADWDPRLATGAFVYLLLRPRRVQVWREANEIAGRTVMRDGSWIE